MHNFILSIAVEPRVVFTPRPLLPETKKDVLSALFLNYVVDNLSCHCDSRYVSCTSQRLRDKIRQHVPKCIQTGRISNSRNTSTCFSKSSTPVMFSKSTIGQHILDNPCAPNIIVIRNLLFFHLTVIVFSFIRFKSRLHQLIQAKVMPPKRVCLHLGNLAMITRLDAFLKHPINFSFSFIRQ